MNEIDQSPSDLEFVLGIFLGFVLGAGLFVLVDGWKVFKGLFL